MTIFFYIYFVKCDNSLSFIQSFNDLIFDLDSPWILLPLTHSISCKPYDINKHNPTCTIIFFYYITNWSPSSFFCCCDQHLGQTRTMWYSLQNLWHTPSTYTLKEPHKPFLCYSFLCIDKQRKANNHMTSYNLLHTLWTTLLSPFPRTHLTWLYIYKWKHKIFCGPLRTTNPNRPFYFLCFYG